MTDTQYLESRFQLSEKSHRYGPRVHLLEDPLSQTLLARLCSPDTKQPLVSNLIEKLYINLLHMVICQEFPRRVQQMVTRMISSHPAEANTKMLLLEPNTRVVSVNLARAGTLPSQVCYQHLNELLNPEFIRQDHINIARTTNARGEVTGSHISGSKIGGDLQDAYVLFPDPMGATGSTLCEIISHYKKFHQGTPKRFIAIHLIVTPEYVKNVLSAFDDIVVYAIRFDRGLSTDRALGAQVGEYPLEEKGLNDHQYIVPGGGGLGEILNNSYV